MDINRIYQGDALELMRSMPDNSVDNVITSPPYNFCLRIHGDKYAKRSPAEKIHDLNVNKYTNGLSDSLSMDEYYDWQCRCIEQMLRVSRETVFYNIQLITGNKVALLRILGRFAENVREVMIWDKQTAEPAMHDKVLNSEYEFIIVFDNGDCKGRQFKTFNAERGTLSNVLRIGKNKGGVHRAAFPLALPQWILQNLTKSGGVILDPFLGSGTTAVACIREKRNFIGFELDEGYFNMAQKRIKTEQSQLTIF